MKFRLKKCIENTNHKCCAKHVFNTKLYYYMVYIMK